MTDETEKRRKRLIIINTILVFILSFVIMELSTLGHYSADLEPGYMVPKDTTGISIVRSRSVIYMTYLVLIIQAFLIASIAYYAIQKRK